MAGDIHIKLPNGVKVIGSRSRATQAEATKPHEPHQPWKHQFHFIVFVKGSEPVQINWRCIVKRHRLYEHSVLAVSIGSIEPLLQLCQINFTCVKFVLACMVQKHRGSTPGTRKIVNRKKQRDTDMTNRKRLQNAAISTNPSLLVWVEEYFI